MSGYGEFEFIAGLLAPLSRGHEGAFGLTDDAAVIAAPPGHELVVTTDALVAGRHFLPDDDPALVARKALRANLSDLAAMGAQPLWYLTSLVWPLGTDRALQSRFVEGLKEDQARFGVTLIGGDTTAAQGPFTVGITAFGAVPAGRAVRRSGAKAGDRLVVTGTIGDAGLGLALATGKLEREAAGGAFLLERHYLPAPRTGLTQALREHAHAAVDISDGLVADAGHVASASGLSLIVKLEDLPLSDAARAWLSRQDDEAAARLLLATSGDDYELACAVGPGEVDDFIAACADQGVTARELGAFETGSGVTVAFDGQEISVERAGFTHF